MEKVFVSRKEAAKALGVCIHTLETYFRSGYVRFIKIQNRVLVPVSELTRLQDAATFGGTILAPIAEQAAR